MAARLPYLHTVIALSERQTDVSIYGFIAIYANTKVYLRSYYILKTSKLYPYIDLLQFLPIPKCIYHFIF